MEKMREVVGMIKFDYKVANGIYFMCAYCGCDDLQIVEKNKEEFVKKCVECGKKFKVVVMEDTQNNTE